MLDKLYQIRFELFFFSQLLILFGSVFIPSVFFENVLSPILFLLNVMTGVILISKRKINMIICIGIFVIILGLFVRVMILEKTDSYSEYIRFGLYFLFYAMVTVEIIKQVWQSKSVNKNVIIGLMTGYLSVGLMGFFILSAVEMTAPGSFSNIVLNEQGVISDKESLLYFSYITLLTIGYGDITPVTVIAQKASVMVGLAGQFYLVILTAIVVGKYLMNSK